MDEVGYEVVLGDVLEAEATDICRKEVKLHGQRIRRAAAKAVVPDEVLPGDPPEGSVEAVEADAPFIQVSNNFTEQLRGCREYPSGCRCQRASRRPTA